MCFSIFVFSFWNEKFKRPTGLIQHSSRTPLSLFVKTLRTQRLTAILLDTATLAVTLVRPIERWVAASISHNTDLALGITPVLVQMIRIAFVMVDVL